MLTLGQYLAPTLKHIPVARFVAPQGSMTSPLVPASDSSSRRRPVRSLQYHAGEMVPSDARADHHA
jgi:lipoate synthase